MATKTKVILKKSNINQYCLVKISGNRFDEVLRLVKEMPVRDFNKEAKCWMVPNKDLMLLVKKLQALGIETQADKDTKQEYTNFIKWKTEQLAIKTLTPENEDLKAFALEMNPDKKLYPFQVLGSYFLYKAGDGMLCDMVGLGKSVQSLTATEKHFIEKDINFCIIICPSTLKRNWEQEVMKWTKKDCFVVGGDKNKRKKQYKNAYKFDYMIINYDLLNHDMHLIDELIISKGYVYSVIIDEIQYIKNHRARRSQHCKKISGFAKYSIGMSATAIENSLMDLWSIFQAVDTTIFGDEKLFWHFKDKFILLDWFGNPVGYKDERTIKKRMAPYTLRRMKEDVLDDLPDRIENNYWVDLSPVQKKFYNEIASQITTSIGDMEKAEKIQFAQILPMITYLRQCVLSAKLVGHPDNISTKTDQLLDFISSIDNKSKMVVFTHFVEMVELLKVSLDQYKIKNICMHGKAGSPLNAPINKRVDIINHFNSDLSTRILVTSDILTEGVNITSAQYLVNFDLLFNPAKMEQRIGRIDRIGNKHKVINIVNLIATDTIEESVYQKVLVKKEMSNDILDDKRIEKRMTFRDIKNLMNI